MICPNCNQSIPEDSQFCHFCGTTIVPTTDEITDPGSESPKTAKEVVSKPKNIARYLITGLALLSLALAILNIIQYTKQSEKDTTILSLQTENESQKQIIAEKDSEIFKQSHTVSAYDKIVNSVESGRLQSAASNFHTDKYIVCLKPGQQEKITLTANWPEGGTVSVDSSSGKAYLTFDEHEWTYYTSVTIGANLYIPNLPLVNVFTFSNNVDNNTFQVLAIITE